MFKTDKKSLEAMSFLSTSSLATLAEFLTELKKRDLCTLGEKDYQRVMDGFGEVARLILNGKTYAFHVEDAYAARQGGDAGYGVGLWRRQGDRLEEYMAPTDRDRVHKPTDFIEHLRRDKIAQIYTGPFNQEFFLNLPKTMDPEDPIDLMGLEENEAEQFKEEGIEVVFLDSLI